MTRHFSKDAHPADRLVNHTIYCDVKEATKILQRSAQRVRAYIREKDPEAKLNLKTAKKIKGKWFIKRAEVQTLHHTLQRAKKQRRKARKAKQREEKLQHLKAMKRIVILDNSIPSDLQEEFLAYIKGRIGQLEP